MKKGPSVIQPGRPTQSDQKMVASKFDTGMSNQPDSGLNTLKNEA